MTRPGRRVLRPERPDDEPRPVLATIALLAIPTAAVLWVGWAIGTITAAGQPLQLVTVRTPGPTVTVTASPSVLPSPTPAPTVTVVPPTVTIPPRTIIRTIAGSTSTTTTTIAATTSTRTVTTTVTPPEETP